MGFGALVRSSLGSGSGEASAPTDLKQVILDRYGRVEDQPPPSLENFYYRASGLAYLCPRREVLHALHKVPIKIRKSAEEIANYDVGSGMHYAMQNIILPAVGALRGAWKCLNCGAVHGWPANRQAVYEAAIRRPMECPKCKGKEFLYHEYFLRDDTIGTGGHMDGLLVLPGHEGMGLFELKSISQMGAKKVKNCPQIEHVLQANVYMRLAGLKWGKILYWVKGVYALDKNLIEHHVEPDEEVWESVKTMLGSIRRGIGGGALPDRICTTRTCSMAQECSMLTPCFGDAEPDDAAGLI